MDRTSNRWESWIKPNIHAMIENSYANPPEPTHKKPKPQYVLWVLGGRTLFDGEMLGLADLNFIDGDAVFGADATHGWAIKVESPDEALALYGRFYGNYAHGLDELDSDGQYYTWRDEEHRDISDLYRERMGE